MKIHSQYVKLLLIIFFIFSIRNISFSQEKKILSLKDCVNLALDKNISIIRANNNLKLSFISEKSAFGNFLPSVNLGGSWSLRIDEKYSYFTSEGQKNSRDVYSLDLNANLSLFTGFRNKFLLRQAHTERAIYEHTLKKSEQDVALQIERLYLNVLKMKKLLLIQEQTLQRSQKQLERIETMRDVGSATQADVFRQKVQVGSDKLNLIKAKNNLNNSLADLSFAIGLDISDNIDVVDININIEEDNYDLDKLINDAIQNREDYIASGEKLKYSGYSIKVSRSGYYPNVSAFSRYGWNGYGIPTGSSDISDFDSFTLGIRFDVPIFDRFITKTNIAKSEIGLINQQEDYEQLRRQIMLEVKKAYLDWQSAKENLQVTNETLASAKEDLRFAEERYAVGSATLLDQITASVQYTIAESNQVQAIYDYYLAKRQLELVTGKLSINK